MYNFTYITERILYLAGALVGEWDRNFPIIHQITGNVSFPNPNTVVVGNFSYDGQGIGKPSRYGPGIKITAKSIMILKISSQDSLGQDYNNRL